MTRYTGYGSKAVSHTDMSRTYIEVRSNNHSQVLDETLLLYRKHEYWDIGMGGETRTYSCN